MDMLQALLQLKQQNKDIDPQNIMIGNGLMNYDFNAGNGNPVFDDYRHLVDGFCMEHTMGFEVLSDSNLMAIKTLISVLRAHTTMQWRPPLSTWRHWRI